MTDQKVLVRQLDGAVTLHADISPYCEGLANDMAVTADGHAYIGNMGYDWEANRPHRARCPHGTVDLATTDVTFPNAPAILSDGVTLVVVDTCDAQYVAWTIRPDGSLVIVVSGPTWTRPSSWAAPARFSPYPALPRTDAPDGCAADPQERIWMTDAAGSRWWSKVGKSSMRSLRPTASPSSPVCLVGMTSKLLHDTAPDHLPTALRAAKASVIYTVDW